MSRKLSDLRDHLWTQNSYLVVGWLIIFWRNEMSFTFKHNLPQNNPRVNETVEAEKGWGGWGTWLEKDERGGRWNEEKIGIEREWKEMERRGRGEGARVEEEIERHTEVRLAKKETQLLVVQLNHKTFMFIGNSWLQGLKKGVISQTCQIGEAAGLLECVKVRRLANLRIWLQENNLPQEGKQTHKSSLLGRVHPRVLTRAIPPQVLPLGWEAG